MYTEYADPVTSQDLPVETVDNIANNEQEQGDSPERLLADVLHYAATHGSKEGAPFTVPFGFNFGERAAGTIYNFLSVGKPARHHSIQMGYWGEEQQLVISRRRHWFSPTKHEQLDISQREKLTKEQVKAVIERTGIKAGEVVPVFLAEMTNKGLTFDPSLIARAHEQGLFTTGYNTKGELFATIVEGVPLIMQDKVKEKAANMGVVAGNPNNKVDEGIMINCRNAELCTPDQVYQVTQLAGFRHIIANAQSQGVTINDLTIESVNIFAGQVHAARISMTVIDSDHKVKHVAYVTPDEQPRKVNHTTIGGLTHVVIGDTNTLPVAKNDAHTRNIYTSFGGMTYFVPTTWNQYPDNPEAARQEIKLLRPIYEVLEETPAAHVAAEMLAIAEAGDTPDIIAALRRRQFTQILERLRLPDEQIPLVVGPNLPPDICTYAALVRLYNDLKRQYDQKIHGLYITDHYTPGKQPFLALLGGIIIDQKDRQTGIISPHLLRIRSICVRPDAVGIALMLENQDDPSQPPVGITVRETRGPIGGFGEQISAGSQDEHGKPTVKGTAINELMEEVGISLLPEEIVYIGTYAAAPVRPGMFPASTEHLSIYAASKGMPGESIENLKGQTRASDPNEVSTVVLTSIPTDGNPADAKTMIGMHALRLGLDVHLQAIEKTTAEVRQRFIERFGEQDAQLIAKYPALADAIAIGLTNVIDDYAIDPHKQAQTTGIQGEDAARQARVNQGIDILLQEIQKRTNGEVVFSRESLHDLLV